MTKNITKLVIDRKRWVRGDDDTALVRYKDKKMCCLGFLGRACGIRRKDMLNQGEPPVLNNYADLIRWPAWLIKKDPHYPEDPLFENTKLASALMTLNDDMKISDKMREYKLKRKFKSVGLEVEFIN